MCHYPLERGCESSCSWVIIPSTYNMCKDKWQCQLMHSDIIIDSTAGQFDYKHAMHGGFFVINLFN